jgi:hypothetical protein
MVVPHEELFEIGIKALEIVGVPEEDARITVDVLVCADLRGFVLPMGLYKGYGLARGKYDYDIPKL